MIMKTLKAIAASLVMATSASAAVTYDDVSHTLKVTGTTTTAQVNAAFMQMHEHDVLTVELAGPGGEYYAGLALGKMIQREGATVLIRENTECVSACAFAALGGEKIVVDGLLKFHVPFMTYVPTNATILEVAQRFGLGYLDMPMYLADVGVTINFANVLMKETSHCKFFVVDDEAEIAKLKDIEAPNQRVSIQHTILDTCR